METLEALMAKINRPSQANVSDGIACPSRRAVMAGLSVTSALALAGCDLIPTNLGTFPFRLTVEIDTPRGVVTGSGVMTASYTEGLNINGGGRRRDASLQGEAIAIDMGPGPDGRPRNLFVLLAHGPMAGDTDTTLWFPVLAIGEPLLWDRTSDGNQHRMFEALARHRDPVTLPLNQVPTIVTFSDVNDPATARVIFATGRKPGRTPMERGEPAVFVDALAEVFGPGHAFRRATIQMVEKGTPVTRGIEGKMPFLRQHSDSYEIRTGPSDPYSAKQYHFNRK